MTRRLTSLPKEGEYRKIFDASARSINLEKLLKP